MPKERFDHRAIEREAQDAWEASGIFETDLANAAKDPYYLLFEFPYPSGDLHIGHWYAFALTDIFARKKRMEGKNLLFPIGFDAFGLPAENAAIKHGTDPKEWTYQNMERMRAQIRSMGTSVDWSKEVATCDPAYYHWTQWLFTKLFEHGLAERRLAPVKWCPKDRTVLANEQVIDGKCERCGSEVEEKHLTQWFLKITSYADRLLEDLEPLPWRSDIKEAQRAWIGESKGAKLSFRMLYEGDEEANAWRDADGNPARVSVFTTRPDTVYGATYLVLAPEHPWVSAALEQGALRNEGAVRRYANDTKRKSERERLENKEKTGVRLEGVVAINPATEEPIPVFAADYVLATYGTGAVMAVPAHDERDFAFAKKFGLPIEQVVVPSFVDERNPPREGAEAVRRKLIIAVVHDPATDAYLALEWPKQGWTTFVTGGVEDGEDVVEAAKREILEETGYGDVEFVRSLGRTEAHYHATHKGENRISDATSLLFTLKSPARSEVASEEAAQHAPIWLPHEELTRARFAHAEMDLVMERLARSEEEAYAGPGSLVDSGAFSGRNNEEAMADMISAVGGEPVTNYRLRDWLVSRQRYWGCPIPVVYDPEGKPHAVPQEHLPWLLPTDVALSEASDDAPLASSSELKERVTRLFGEGWTPEVDTLDTFVDSSWYFLRYLAPHDEHAFSDPGAMKRWVPVDRYSGGSEHTTMHLLYARFFHKALYDLALVPTPEPFHERFNRGLILGPDGNKMSKSKGNVINPDDFVQKFGADAVRAYLAFIGPYNEPGNYPWNLDGVESMRRFLDRIYQLRERVADADASRETAIALAKAIAKVTDDVERFKFNTAIATLMVLVRELEGLERVPRASYGTLLRLASPFAPHLAEHLWKETGGEGLLAGAAWPVADPELLVEDEVTISVQVNGKRKGEVRIAANSDEDAVREAALALPVVLTALAGSEPKRVIYVPGRTLNLVAGG